jgi:hypothetical protein
VRRSSFEDSCSPEPSVASQPETEESQRPSSGPLPLAVAAVFGIPFLYCLQGAARGRLFIGPHSFFADAPLVPGSIAWAVTAALGSLWLGVSLLLGPASRRSERVHNALGFALTLAGVAVLFLSARLLR